MSSESLLPALTIGFAVLAIAVTFFGVLVALLVALGKRLWIWALPMLVLGPFVALPFSFVDPDAAYARRLLLTGVLFAVPAAVLFVLTSVLFRSQ